MDWRRAALCSIIAAQEKRDRPSPNSYSQSTIRESEGEKSVSIGYSVEEIMLMS
jgi:hypothetical protein